MQTPSDHISNLRKGQKELPNPESEPISETYDPPPLRSSQRSQQVLTTLLSVKVMALPLEHHISRIRATYWPHVDYGKDQDRSDLNPIYLEPCPGASYMFSLNRKRVIVTVKPNEVPRQGLERLYYIERLARREELHGGDDIHKKANALSLEDMIFRR